MNLDGYVRVSRVAGRSGEQFISPTDQRQRIETYAQAQGHKVVMVHEDLDQPGSKLARPGFQAAIERVERGESDGIVVAALDRFARSVIDAATALRRLEDAGGVLISVKDSLDTSTPVGKFARTMMLAIAELELDRVRENWSTAQAHAVARGVHVASRTPTGYQKRDDGRLEPDPLAAPVVAEVFRRRAAGAGWGGLAQYMNEAHVVGPYGNANWTNSVVGKLLKNPVYLGQARSGDHVNNQAHEPIVTRAEWEAAQSVNAITVAPAKKGDGALLAGLIRCTGCRYLMKPDKMKNRDGSPLNLYRCRGSSAAGHCESQATILAHLIDPHVEAVFLKALEDGGLLAEAAADTEALDATMRKLDEAEVELVVYNDTELISVIGAKSFRSGLETRALAVDDAKREFSKAHQSAALPTDGLTPGDLRAAWPDLSVAERRTLLRSAIDAVMVRRVRGSGRRVPVDERTLLLWHGEAPDDLPRRGRRVPFKPFEWPNNDPTHVGVPVT